MINKKVFLFILFIVLSSSIVLYTQKKNSLVGIALYRYDDDYTKYLKLYLERNAKNNFSVLMVDSYNSQATQNAQIDMFLKKKVNMLAINLVDKTQAQKIIDKVSINDLPLIFFNREPDLDAMKTYDKVWYICGKSDEAGIAQGRLIAESWKNRLNWDKNEDGKIQCIIIKGDLNDYDTLELYKTYMAKVIEEAKEATFISTKHKWISIVNVMFAVYRLKQTQGRLTFIPPELLSNKSIVPYNEDNNLCFWAAYASYLHDIGHNHPHRKLISEQDSFKKRQLTTDAKSLLIAFHPDITNINLYQGFDLTTELKPFTMWAKIDVNIYDYDCTSKKFNLFQSVKCSLTDSCTAEETKTEVQVMNILLITQNCKTHVMYIKDVERLTGILICPKCHSYCYNMRGGDRNKKRFDEHVSKCTGKPEKQFRFDIPSHPYCPHLWKTPYAKLLSYHEGEYWKPTRYYMTYDFETMDQVIDKSITNKTTLDAHLVPLSVALTVYSPNGTNTYWFCAKDKDFINSFIECMFAHYDEVFTANTIRSPSCTIEPRHVTVLGYNSGKFDMNILIPYLNNDKWHVVDLIGTMSNFKSLRVANAEGKVLSFVDAMHYVTPQPLKDFIRNFGSEGCPDKGLFPYEAFNSENFDEVLSETSPFPHEAFYSKLAGKNITDEEYQTYVDDAKNFKNRWEYLEHYNKLDTVSMISPLNNLIERTAQWKVDMLSNLSLSANSSTTKYAMAYKDFDPFANYARQEKTTFKMTKKWWANKCRAYLEQDRNKKRDTTNNVSVKDFDYFAEKFSTETCYLCHEGFTFENTPTLDRINNDLGHSKDNVKICCRYCNTVKSDRSEQEARLYVALRKYCLLHNLPMTINNEEVYRLLRKGITGGMSNVLHRLNIKYQTPINHLEVEFD